VQLGRPYVKVTPRNGLLFAFELFSFGPVIGFFKPLDGSR